MLPHFSIWLSLMTWKSSCKCYNTREYVMDYQNQLIFLYEAFIFMNHSFHHVVVLFISFHRLFNKSWSRWFRWSVQCFKSPHNQFKLVFWYYKTLFFEIWVLKYNKNTWNEDEKWKFLSLMIFSESSNWSCCWKNSQQFLTVY